MSNKKIILEPYLFFNGNCEEALNYYSKIFGGSINRVERYDNPAMNAPKEYQNKILHAALQFGDITILASDVPPGQPGDHGSADTSLSITVENAEEGKEIFKKLAEGGRVNVPFEKQFWGAWHGNLQDRFGINWMVNCNL